MKSKVNKIYENKEKFLVIGLTGKTGSGCSTVSQILQNGYKEYNEFEKNISIIQNKKNTIIKKFATKILIVLKENLNLLSLLL